ncbi:DUF1178 family protein [Algihabitans albus]|uniref:DUF1178 family protein n=1 Tax=Algihabitans albus TaxID=2164067 RepID=UPI000E5D6D3A|nr:DUF1178 family protein [Algihabitans albus]
MIKYALQCDRDHGFEGWFQNSAAFDAQAGNGELVCPFCGSASVRKAVMAPRIGASREVMPADGKTSPGEPDVLATDRGEVQAVSKAGPDEAKLRGKLLELREIVEASCSHVGSDFAEEARKIHYGETEPRGIYGETSREEAEALSEEGIEVARIPWISRGDA